MGKKRGLKRGGGEDKEVQTGEAEEDKEED